MKSVPTALSGTRPRHRCTKTHWLNCHHEFNPRRISSRVVQARGVVNNAYITNFSVVRSWGEGQRSRVRVFEIADLIFSMAS